MVFSHLNKSIEYLETREIDPEDVDYETALYEMEIYGKPHAVALGKVKYTYSTKYGIVYFPIYLIRKDKIRGKIGVYELERSRLPAAFDKEKDVKIDILGEPLWFLKTTEEYILKTDAIYIPDSSTKDLGEEAEEEPEKPIPETEEKQETQKTEEDTEEEEDDDVLSLQKQEIKPSTNKETTRITLDDIFTKDKTTPQTTTWPEETAEQSKQAHEEYAIKKSTNDIWVQEFFKNKNYGIQKNEGGGDCLFAVIRDAFQEIGYHTTVQKLRTLLSQEVTLAQLETLTNIYRGILHGKENAEHELEVISKANKTLKKQSNIKDKAQLKEILGGAKELKKKYGELKSKHNIDQELLNEFGYMKDIKTVDDLKTYIRTSSYWADTWAISTLERLLEIKIIILEDTSDKDAVMRCGQLNDEITTFTPKFYILANYTMSGNHYELITYKKKRLFVFSEVPYDVKVLVVNKCMEKAAGPYAIIPAFKQFQLDLGMEPAEEKLILEIQEEGLCEQDVVFVFHGASDNSKKPGDGVQEKLEKTRLSEFAGLIQKPPLAWRQQLDDTWSTAPFTVDHLRWSSVAHYLLALPFKSGEGEIYKQFSLDGDHPEIAEKLEVAKESIEKKKGKEGKYYSQFRKLDKPLAHDIESARKEALMAKFSQNADLTTMLLNTKKACLNQFRRGKEIEPDTLLMSVRKSLNKTA
jgi:predicted NAD-dependent protein-ADP-ribosyltransferase YbiA (DUF1768 family)